MDKTIINFDDTEIEKYNFHQHKSPILIDNIVINPITTKVLGGYVTLRKQIPPTLSPLRKFLTKRTIITKLGTNIVYQSINLQTSWYQYVGRDVIYKLMTS